jgi:NitT/TauT family transport system permease protein
MLLAIGTMIVMVVGVNAVFWRPLTAWAERFRFEQAAASQAPRSIMLEMLRRSAVPAVVGRAMRPAGRLLDRLTRPFGLAEYPLLLDRRRQRIGDAVFAAVVAEGLILGTWRMLAYVQHGTGLGEFRHAFLLGLATFARVLVVIVAGTVVWVPVGVWIGMNPKVSRFAQPVVQVLASFPTNFLFPLFTLALIRTHLSIDIGGIALMALGAQWYILFNVIAGASAIPTDLREAAANLGLSRVQRWRSLIGPAIFSAWVTGGITAAGGAWNASIVAEVVSYGHHTLVATGLGAYIARSTADGNFARTLVGVTVMSVYVVALNRFFWRRLYHLAETRYSLQHS